MDDDKEPKIDKDMKLAELCRVMGPVEAGVIKNFLESHGISCILQGQMLQAIYPSLIDGLGEIRVLVAEKDLAGAKELLAAIDEERSEEK
jgi:hypothetical protein